MAKRIAFSADGTWDTATTQSNVYRLYKALVVSADQMPFYDDGVGADGNPVLKVLGGALGTGIYDKIKQGYTKIAQVYDQDDDIFIFGFSRGAFTARSLVGMIAACGLPTENFSDDVVNRAFDAYRERDANSRKQKLQQLTTRYGLYDAKIKMVGVWDTVGSMGLLSVVSGVDPLEYGFLDTKLHPDVQNAYHALAIDESRLQFQPTLWDEPGAPGQTLQQVWFCGVHSDVGGGEKDVRDGTPALSDITLSWMLDKASGLGLEIDPVAKAKYASPLDSKYAATELHTSFSGPPKPRSIPEKALISNSVLIRFQSDPTWRPDALKTVNGALASGYQVVSIMREPAAVAGAPGGGGTGT